DVDGDGKPDLVFIQSGSIAVMRNTSTPGSISAASFAAKLNFTPAFSGAYVVAIGDLDGDGKPELVSANSTANTISIVRNTSTPGILSFAPKVDFATGGTPSSITIGHVDGDGKPDLLVANAAVGVNSISVLRNISTPGTIAISPKVDFTTGTGPRSVAIADVDGDGKPDMVVANSSTAVPASTTLSVLRNTSTTGIDASSFAPKADFIAGTGPRYVALGDLDGDGKPDIVAANINSNTISVLRNNSTPGSLAFATKVDFGTATGPVAVAIVDIDGDGIPEIAAANGSAGSVSVFQIDLSAIPVTISNVRANQQNAGVRIEWTTHQEINIHRYEVERSHNGQQFILMGNVLARGNSSLTNYHWFDANPLHGVSFYRIKIVEAGQVTYSQIVRVNITNDPVSKLTIYPNPVNGNIISLQMNLLRGSYIISLTNKLGQQLVTKVIDHVGGSATENLESSKTLAAGVYQIRITGGGINIIHQVIKK
ncbi:MAG TPA: T9SS type A sorting domain-containing protein, partial [Ferruginibacter sp.]|nr:T9SS type A sorting domain-containing protein [Ferruginibacter sp.]